MISLKNNCLNAGLIISSLLASQVTFAHYPFVAPLAYQTFNNHAAIISGFYDNPFASEVAIKNFNFHYHKPSGEKIAIHSDLWAKTQTLSSYSLETKEDGTYRIRGEKQGSSSNFAWVGNEWKPIIRAAKKQANLKNDKIVYASDLKENTQQKEIKTIDIVETFISRRKVSKQVIDHIHSGFDIQFLTHPNQIKSNQFIRLKLLNDQQPIKDLKVEILAATTDFSREGKVYQTLTTDAQGALKFNIADKGQYLLKIDYQQPFSSPANSLKRYKYTLAFNVID